MTKLIEDILMVAGKTLNELVGAVPRPDRLFHFTDSNGLIGILDKRTLWATLATSLNDVSEIQHGLGRARKLLESNAADAPSSFLKKIEHYLDPDNAFPLGTWHLHTFLISLCARIDRSVHWLHYGRSGTGFAIGFDVNGLEKSPFVLVPVIYDEQAQDQLLRQMIESVSKCLDNSAYQSSAESARSQVDLAANVTARFIWTASSLLKNPVFANEEEWRLITTTYNISFLGKPLIENPALPTSIRSAGGRLVPYKELIFDELPVNEIVLGASVPMAPEDPAFGMLIEATLDDRAVKVTRSPVPVRQ